MVRKILFYLSTEKIYFIFYFILRLRYYKNYTVLRCTMQALFYFICACIVLVLVLVYSIPLCAQHVAAYRVEVGIDVLLDCVAKLLHCVVELCYCFVIAFVSTLHTYIEVVVCLQHTRNCVFAAVKQCLQLLRCCCCCCCALCCYCIAKCVHVFATLLVCCYTYTLACCVVQCKH